MSRATIHVCTRCRLASAPRRDGYDTHGQEVRDQIAKALREAGLSERFRIEETGCHGGSNRRCRISVADPARWSWIFADLHPEDGAGEIIRFLHEWDASELGLIPKEDRSAWLLSHAVGRMPPLLPTEPNLVAPEGPTGSGKT